MSQVKVDGIREYRIEMEVIVDAYDEHERAMGWYYYLENQLHFPFAAICSAKRPISPLRLKDKVEVVGVPPEEECAREIFVLIRWERRRLAVPLSQLTVLDADESTRDAVEDWHYWVRRGYLF